jgi:L-threonylcarbamoyladenylate synthase
MRMLPVTDENIRIAAEALRAGKLAAFPTETVYGLGADAFNPRALAAVFEAKGRPRFDPLIIHIADLAALDRIVQIGPRDRELRRRFEALAARFWPGPLTLILPKRREVPGLATAGLPTAAVRFPAHPAAQALIRLSTGAVAAPSANPFGCLSPTRAEHVREGLGDRVDIILDGGPAAVGVESTILDLHGDPPRLLRPGGIPREGLEEILGPLAPGPDAAGSAGDVSGVFSGPPETGPEGLPAPGLLKSHYAPRTPLRVHSRGEMLALAYNPGEAYLFFDGSSRDPWIAAGHIPRDPGIRVLSVRGDLAEAAANLFDLLHDLDGLGRSLIRAERVPGTGLGLAVNDRLCRAASPDAPACPTVTE